MKAFDIKTDEGTPVFPLLAKLVKVLLRIYSGPVVESSFKGVHGLENIFLYFLFYIKLKYTTTFALKKYTKNILKFDP